MPETTWVAISRIRIDGNTQTRSCVREDVVEEYAAVIEAGGDLPNAVVFDDGEHLWMGDGFHRHKAYILAGKTEMPVSMQAGTKRDALLFSAGANNAHGLRRSNEDKRKAVRMLLADEEWAQKSDRWIAEKAHVSEHTVAAVRAESTAQTRSCPQKAEENDQKLNYDNGKRTGKDGKERPVRKLQIFCDRCTRVGVVEGCPTCAHSRVKVVDVGKEQDELEDGEIVDADGFPVPAKLREIFAIVPLFRSTQMLCSRAAANVKECEESKAYKQADSAQIDDTKGRRVYSSLLFTTAKKLKDIAPAIVCNPCVGNACGKCGGKGWLTDAERHNES